VKNTFHLFNIFSHVKWMKMLRYFFAAVLIIISLSCKQNTSKVVENSESTGKISSIYQEPYRPQFHFTPAEKWMNDPNGLVYHQGVYHLFYQFYPDDIVWGPMHWGHATSTDMIHWEHKPIALYPDEHGLIFSGSAVVDTQNTSGFGTTDNPPLVAIFTYHDMEAEKAGKFDYQTQGIAYSLDNGETWTKYEKNPVIGNTGIKDFRDPKVFWHEASSRWILTLVAGDHARFYGSSNLKDWKLLSEFGKELGAHGGVWECPDLFPLKVKGSEEEKWVLLISINPGAPNGGSGTQYFIGDFDGTSFTTAQKDIRWIDHGMDNYAGVTYNNAPNNERIFIGWMSNWNYARDTPTQTWRSAMTLPRNFSLHKDASGYFLKNYPLPTFDSIRTAEEITNIISVSEPYHLTLVNLMQKDISFQADLSKDLLLTIGNETEKFSLHINPAKKLLEFDRSKSGLVSFEKSFGEKVQTQAYEPKSTEAEIRLIIDQSSVEIFIDGGKYVFTNQIFPTKPYNQLTLLGDVEELTQVKLFKINSIWNEK
jgi:fructan beta-fructosidase